MWQGIYGHDAIVEQFRRTLAAGRLASTYLFVGPEGIGKRAFALKLAQALLCTSADERALEPCGQCHSCLLCGAGNHPDLHSVEPKRGTKNLLLDQFIGPKEHRHQEGLCHDLALRPLMSRRRVAVIDNADWLTTESANTLLKTLEEPPAGAVIILLGTSRSRQLPTILSRAQFVRFHPLPRDVVRDLALAEGLASDIGAAAHLADRSEGSVTRAKMLANPELWRMRDRIMAAWHAGEIDVAQLARDVEAHAAEAGKEPDLRRGRLRQIFFLVGDALAQSLRESRSPFDEVERTLAALDRCLEAEEQLDRNANQATLLENWLNDLAVLASGPAVAAR